MTEREQRDGDSSAGRGGDRRGGDRRSSDRRRNDRRTPPPPWRRPWAYVAYGVVGALVLVLFLRAGDDEPDADDLARVRTAPLPPAVIDSPTPAAGRPVEDAYTTRDFERLLARGEDAVGQRVRTELYCAPLRRMTLREVGEVNPAVAALSDVQRQVPAAECRWGREQEGQQDLVLLVPPDLADEFASAPMVTVAFVERRRVRSQVEWVGRSEALSLQVVGILRGVTP